MIGRAGAYFISRLYGLSIASLPQLLLIWSCIDFSGEPLVSLTGWLTRAACTLQQRRNQQEGLPFKDANNKFRVAIRELAGSVDTTTLPASMCD